MNKNDDFLEKYLSQSIEAYKSDEEKAELTRRIEWAVLLSEEKFKDETERSKHINSLANSLLVASSFLSAGFIQYLTSLKLEQISAKSAFFVIFAGAFLVCSIIMQLFLVTYKGIRRSKSVKDTTTAYLDKSVSFKNPYSENLGRLLTLDELFECLKSRNNFLAKIQRLATWLLMAFLIAFFVCFFVR